MLLGAHVDASCSFSWADTWGCLGVEVPGPQGGGAASPFTSPPAVRGVHPFWFLLVSCDVLLKSDHFKQNDMFTLEARISLHFGISFIAACLLGDFSGLIL